MDNLEAKEAYYRGAVFGGADAKPVKITDVTWSEAKDEKLQFHFHCEIASKLNDPYNPAAGGEPITAQSVAVLVQVKDDMKQTLDVLNRAFELKEPLVDDPEWFLRLTEDHPKSVLPEILNKEAWLYIASSPRQTANGDLMIYWNFRSPAKQKKPRSADLKKFLPATF